MVRVAAEAELVTAPRVFATGRSAMTRWSGQATVTDSGRPPSASDADFAGAPPESDVPPSDGSAASLGLFFPSLLGLGFSFARVDM
jgi:hypothetical protein